MAPVECTKWIASTWDCTLGHSCVHWDSRLTMDFSGVRIFIVETLNSFSQAVATSNPTPLHSPHAWLPLSYTGLNLVHTFKNDLKWPKIKQVTNSKLYYNKFNRSIIPVFQSKVSLTQAKAGYTN